MGTGSKTTLSQIVAEVLGLSYEDIDIILGDTFATPYDYGSCASRTLYIAGFASQQAAQDAKKKILQLAASKLGISPNRLEMKDKKVFIKEKPETYIAVSELLTSSITGYYYPERIKTVAPLREATYVGGAVVHIAEVEVDTETGEVKVLRYVAAHDVGRAINPTIVENQICGAIVMGIGYALTEKLIYNEEGTCVTPDYMDYKLCGIMDVPEEIIPILVESGEPTGPFGGKGIGEHALNPVAGVIANAIYNAIGVRINQLPMTPEKIVARLAQR
jgi:xanthine dehydrogenase molybdenum-binding subunit